MKHFERGVSGDYADENATTAAAAADDLAKHSFIRNYTQMPLRSQ